MNNMESKVISEVHLQTLAKSIYNESTQMGFKSADYVKLMNHILSMTITNSTSISERPIITLNAANNSKSLPIKGKNLIIRKYDEKTDDKYIEKWFLDDISKLFLLSTTSAKIKNIKSLISDEKNIFATITTLDKISIGLLAILNVDYHNKKGEMRKLIGDANFRGKGFAKEASILWIDYCSNVLGLNKIYINTIDTNIKNISLNRQLGFHIEGLLKKEIVIDGVEHDVLRMAYFKNL